MTGPDRRYQLITIAIWLLTVAVSYSWNNYDNKQDQRALATEAAKAFFAQIVATRNWNSNHSGIFVYSTTDTPPNPYLPTEQQTIFDSSGRSLTRVNPAYMTRQIAEVLAKQSNVRFHITSLAPLRKENKASDWETRWLHDFEAGELEKSRFVDTEDGRFFRYMAPLKVNKSCLPCHAEQGYMVGNIRGGISITMPALADRSPLPLLFSHLLAAVIGIFIILFFISRLNREQIKLREINEQLKNEIKEKKKTELKLIEIREDLESRVISRTSELNNTNRLLDARIKEQQQVKASLVSINDEFVQLFNSAPDGMHVINKQFTIIRANRAFCKLTNMDAHDIVGQKCFDIFPGHPCHTQNCPLTMILNGQEHVEIEMLKTRQNGTRFPCQVVATPFREPSGKLIGIIQVTRDISNWKAIKDSLSMAAEDLQVRNQELQDFAHVISHDLQEPLMLITAFSDRLRKSINDSLEDKPKSYLKRIISSTNRMQSLINGLLLYSRVSSKGQPFEAVNLNDVVHSVLDDLAIRIEETHGKVTVGKLPEVEADPLQMRQLYQNIIGNSLKYHHPARRPKIEIDVRPFTDDYNRENYCRFYIKDNGIGFKNEYSERIFEIFQRLHTRQQFSGTGIGLSICKKIVDRHHGTIVATGISDSGSEFIITLPLSQSRINTGDQTMFDAKFISAVINRR
ncbi:MAG: DUF3365 domain-containing protein [Thermodesulfobacteriota bacterium]